MVAMLAGGAAVCMTGCGSNSDPVDGPRAKYPDVPSYCTERAKAECSAEVVDRCQTEQGDCVVARTGACGQSTVAGARVRETEADACIAATEAAHQDEKITPNEVGVMNEACADVFGGVGGEGTACRTNMDCDPNADLECIIAAGASSGNCRVPDIKAAGTACDAQDAVCEEGYYCTPSDRVCAAKQALNRPCDATRLCADDLRCVPTAPLEPVGTCQAKLGVGEQCETAEQCNSGICGMVKTTRQCMSSLYFGPSEPICDAYRT
jgi:hypothetical protein